MSQGKRALLEAAVTTIARHGVRGLRVEEVAHQAGVSTALIYHHFGDRSTLLQNALLQIEQAAQRYTVATGETERETLVEAVLAEIQDDEAVRENSVAWGELRDVAIFEPRLRATLKVLTNQWIDRLARIIIDGQQDGSIPAEVEPWASAQRLTAMVEGLSSRWLPGLLSTRTARDLLETAVHRELDGAQMHSPASNGPAAPD